MIGGYESARTHSEGEFPNRAAKLTRPAAFTHDSQHMCGIHHVNTRQKRDTTRLKNLRHERG